MNKEKIMDNQNCRFCDYVSGENVTRLIDVPWKESQNYAAFISQGAFVLGWTIVVPKAHTHNMSLHYGNPELELFIESVCKDQKKAFGLDSVLFEHGPTRKGSLVGCGTNHAHLHLVPFARSLKMAVKMFSPEYQWKSVSLSRNLDLKDEYLLFAERSNNRFNAAYAREVETPTSQYFRQVLAESLGIPSLFDYKRDPMLKEAESSLMKMKAIQLEKVN